MLIFSLNDIDMHDEDYDHDYIFEEKKNSEKYIVKCFIAPINSLTVTETNTEIEKHYFLVW